MSHDNLTMLFTEMQFIVEDPGQRIIEHTRCFIEANAMFDAI